MLVLDLLAFMPRAPRALLLGVTLLLGTLLAAMAVALAGLDVVFAHHPALRGPCLFDNMWDNCYPNGAGRLTCVNGALLSVAGDALVLPVGLNLTSIGDDPVPSEFTFTRGSAATRAAGCRWTYLMLDFWLGDEHYFWQGPVNMSLYASESWTVADRSSMSMRSIFDAPPDAPRNATFGGLMFVAAATRHAEPLVSYAAALWAFCLLADTVPAAVFGVYIFTGLALRPVGLDDAWAARKPTAALLAAARHLGALEALFYGAVVTTSCITPALRLPALAPTADDRAPPLAASELALIAVACTMLLATLGCLTIIGLLESVRVLDDEFGGAHELPFFGRRGMKRGWLRHTALWAAWPICALFARWL